MRILSVVLGIGFLLVGFEGLPAWGQDGTISQVQENVLPCVDRTDAEEGVLQNLTLALFAKQDAVYDDGSGGDDTTDTADEEREPSWLELYIALGGIILVALGIVRLAEVRRLDDPCFIATAAWGTPYAPEVNLLRGWRDKYLLTSVAGVAFVDVYYRLSPAVAEHVARSPILALLVRLLLIPVLLVSNGVLFAVVVVPIFLLMVSGIGLFIWFRWFRRQYDDISTVGENGHASPGSR